MVLLGYKKCQPINDYNIRLIGIFEILEYSKISPKISNEFIKFRVNKCKLIGVEDLQGNPIEMKELETVNFLNTDPHIIFKLNEIVEVDLFDENEKYIGNGILMFLNKLRAQNYLVDYLKDGLITKWRDNGILYSEESFSNYNKNGVCKYYHENGNIKEFSEYNKGYLINIQIIYDISGNIIKKNDFTIKKILYTNMYNSRTT